MNTPPRAADDPAIRSKNIRLGLTIGLIVAALSVGALIRFSVWGLPVDKSAHERIEQQRSASEALDDQDGSTEGADAEGTDHDQ